MRSAPLTGALAWVGLAAADAAAAVEFYTATFGWEAAREPDHTRLSQAGKDVALVYPQTRHAQAANVTSHWSPFFFVGDAAPALERAVQAKGMALRDPFDVTRGTVVPLRDPAGAIFSIWAPRPPDATEPSASGAWWLELRTPDLAASQAFYNHLLDWTFAPISSGAGIRGPEGPIGAIRAVQTRPEWSPFLRLTDAEEGARRAETAGAPFVGAPEETTLGRVVAIVDPQGAALTLLEPA
jgi:predicted enzyme related to lactoylglutathione lyase